MKTRNNEMMEAKIKVKNIDSHFSELRKRKFNLIAIFVFHRKMSQLIDDKENVIMK